ncbi:bifunctional diaminohydroxyphosphoribosylaminopyrimidine deaminase/5-amino-6-(5-phosphoribosylamino)uracil reductase RibD [Streptomyces sp. WAC 00631]|uniref:bifunctional diaminohydroxyphosphoribosylaminopyrimidine deaminase/5-amino-6-(5-phosphoribosylamino)uracil reductase RibD n=1 Tax=unclassified Streptomyces TaxID=2593676 RepID=UPI000F7B0F6B|nr:MULTISPECIES: bifunctional diaminohydroxyphosphoribosylaminopyrimidine deaminase/5-amino-6-(5-phosphoribosylamino)uracil reductase RibD [unclassified Streptomyces]MCC5033961.1 bifunctional diaminohydroxyphosphoribosylaminopyrimidine deaminase/5-amino-6-(5-phosphoribosylamino)uracil reductase RibD [Streptomyces sp. WAC 00631]MCC9742652.1 bifunctional diaminohydroxyphosphoribosylaminopyrimidine deaminase/5-amino-6-(5-phosphoribosylamino)uracil reductase RibD [Streptomyces sp. MNU89]
MRRAVALAARGTGSTSPNPVVGCVILDAAGQPAGEGYHQRAGGPHAEIHALRAAGERARGGTALVTLEPCDHTGRTGPCTGALIDAGIARVVYAVADPHDEAAGGAATLAAAGIEVERGLLAAEAEEVNLPWLTSVRRRRPFVRWKYAATLDGRTAAADGTSRWISSPASRADVHRLRAEADAVIVGSGTARADDPQLAVRHPGLLDTLGAGLRQPLRVVVDSNASAVRPGARVLDGSAPTLVAVAEEADAAHLEGLVPVVRLPRAPGGRGLSIPMLLRTLYEREVRSVLLEGGATLAGAFVAARSVDQVVGYLAPALLGAGPAVLADAGIGTITDALRLDVTGVDRLGPDLRITAVPGGPAPAAAPATSAVPASEEN